MDVLGFGDGAPEASENIKKWVKKSMETSKIAKVFHEFFSEFWLEKANVNKN